jgi:hypothetical protein
LNLEAGAPAKKAISANSPLYSQERSLHSHGRPGVLIFVEPEMALSRPPPYSARPRFVEYCTVHQRHQQPTGPVTLSLTGHAQ